MLKIYCFKSKPLRSGSFSTEELSEDGVHLHRLLLLYLFVRTKDDAYGKQ